MTIGIDIDDTICDTINNIIPALCEYYKLDKNDFIDSYKKDNSIIEKLPNYLDFAQIYYPKILPTLPLFKDCQKYINKLHENNKIIFITARLTLGKDLSYKYGYDYLTKNGIIFDDLLIGVKDKKKICDDYNIDVFIDNNINNCVKVSNNKDIKVLLYDNEYNKNNNTLTRVYSWKEIYEVISNL